LYEQQLHAASMADPLSLERLGELLDREL
jgi:hypothetical protein